MCKCNVGKSFKLGEVVSSSMFLFFGDFLRCIIGYRGGSLFFFIRVFVIYVGYKINI